MFNPYPCRRCGKPGWVEVKRNGETFYLCKRCYFKDVKSFVRSVKDDVEDFRG